MKGREDIISRIRKLLALGRDNPSAEEATSAVLMAQRLIVKYGVSDDELNADGDAPENIVGVDAEPLVNARAWRWQLACIIADSFRCKMWQTKYMSAGRARKKFTFYGYEQDAQAASLAFTYLYRTGNRLANAAVREVKRKGYLVDGAYNSYIMGFLGGLRTELEKQSRELLVVMPLAVQEKYEREVCGSIKIKELKEISCDHYHAWLIERGLRDGRDAVRSRRLEDTHDFALCG